MGAEESRAGNYGLMGANSVNRNMNKQIQRARPWSLLHQCSVDQWKAGHAEAAGFQETIMSCSGVVFKDCSVTFCTSRQGIINIKSGPIFSFRRKSKFTKMAEHFEYNHIPAHLSSIQNFHVKSVLCYKGNTVILHLVRNLMTQFGIIDLHQNKFLGIFGHQTVEFVNEALRGEISPDGTMVMIKIPSLKTGNNAFVFQLYDLDTKQLVSEISPPYNHSIFAFDPKSCSSRLAMTSFKEGHDNSLCLVRAASWDILAINSRVDDLRTSLHPNLKDLKYSLEGNILFAVMVTSGCHCREKRTRRFQPIDVSIYIFDGENAQTLHCIQYHRYACGVHSCPINYMPTFSYCGSRMAIVLNDMETSTDHIQIYKLPIYGNLQNRCRIRILQQFSPEIIERLPLPARLINYLRFQPEYV
ncbi:uncharacterized protein LOC126810094 isoform X2 [Patella vulgata]|nr:uncharacterized protein LOC126810094 isoform X2 [Patella vulgata]XP_050391017.1 uncharacterized protein LOC126810094 isoform X2 [Patella vulgata]